MDRSHRSTQLLLATITTVLVGWGLKATQSVTMPLAFALVLLLFFRPLQSRLDAHLPRWVGVLVVLFACLAFLGFLGSVASYSASRVADRLPGYTDEVSAQLGALESRLSSWGIAISLPGDPAEGADERNDAGATPATGNAATPDAEEGGGDSAAAGGGPERSGVAASGAGFDLRGRAATLLTGFGSSLVTIVLTLTILVFLLIEVYDFRDKLRGGSGGPSGDRMLDAFDRMAHKFQRYVLVQGFTSVLTGALTWGWCALLGLELAFLWGLVAFAFNFVPTVGSILAVVPPTLFALGFGGPLVALGVFGGLAVIQLVLGNFVDPALQGQAVDLVPVVVLLSVVFWSWLWGIGGAIIAVPMTLALVLVFDEFDGTRPVARFLSESRGE